MKIQFIICRVLLRAAMVRLLQWAHLYIDFLFAGQFPALLPIASPDYRRKPGRFFFFPLIQI